MPIIYGTTLTNTSTLQFNKYDRYINTLTVMVVYMIVLLLTCWILSKLLTYLLKLVLKKKSTEITIAHIMIAILIIYLTTAIIRYFILFQKKTNKSVNDILKLMRTDFRYINSHIIYAKNTVIHKFMKLINK